MTSEDEAYAHARSLDELDQITFDAICKCDDTYGDYPWCPACYPTSGQLDNGGAP